MKSFTDFQQEIITSLEGLGTFKEVKIIHNGKKEGLNLREPSAAVASKKMESLSDKGFQLMKFSFSVYMKVLNIAGEHNMTVVENAFKELAQLDPSEINLNSESADSRTATYRIDIGFNGALI
jgi:hypothetical protein